ncbi:MAG TPA: hypothetical protein VMF05_06015 [Stellaceae bacterium]|nr:hypothetical protein [Stellaceae bacterium]
MADPTLTVRITADTAGFDLDPAVQKMAELRIAAVQASQAASASMADLQRSIKALSEAGGATAAQFKNLVADAVVVNQTQQAAAGAMKTLRDGIAGAAANTYELREGFVAIHEVVTGRFSRLPGTFMELVMWSGQLRSALSALTSPWAGIAAGATAHGGDLWRSRLASRRRGQFHQSHSRRPGLGGTWSRNQYG